MRKLILNYSATCGIPTPPCYLFIALSGVGTLTTFSLICWNALVNHPRLWSIRRVLSIRTGSVYLSLSHSIYTSMHLSSLRTQPSHHWHSTKITKCERYVVMFSRDWKVVNTSAQVILVRCSRNTKTICYKSFTLPTFQHFYTSIVCFLLRTNILVII